MIRNLTVSAYSVHTSSHTYSATLTEYQCELVFGWKIFTTNSTAHSHTYPQNHLALGSHLLEAAKKKHYGTWKEKPRPGLVGKWKQKGSLRRLNRPLNVFPELSHPMPAIFMER